jgi:cobalt-zinc-cadmium efflux system membrane fusion protein
MKTNLSKKQLTTIVAITVIGALLGALILLTDKSAPSGEQGHGQHAVHEEHAGHDEGKEEKEHTDGNKHEEEQAHEEETAEHKDGPAEGEHAEKIALTDDQIKAANIDIRQAGAATIDSTLTLPGEIRYNEDRTAHVVPRLAGVVESVRVRQGQQVRKGDVLAVIASSDLSEQRSTLLSAQKRYALAKLTFDREKKLWQEKISAEQDYLQAEQAMQEADIAVRNARQKLNAIGASSGNPNNLNSYEVRAPFNGMVMEKHISLGEAIKEDAAIFTISDLSTVWAEVAVPAKELNAVRVGEKVTIKATAFEAQAIGTVAYVGSLLGEQTRTAKAHVTLANPKLAWRPGLFVNVKIVSEQTKVAVAISADAIQSINDKTTIFVRVPGGFTAQQVSLGRSDGKLVEVTNGLKAGTQYAANGSFIVKSEQGKASAEHAH